MSEPKPCPFCGRQAHTYKLEYSEFVIGKTFAHCIFGGCIGNSIEAWTIEEWNTRPLEDALLAEVARLTAEVERLRDLNRWRDARPGSSELPEDGQRVEVINAVGWLRDIIYSADHGWHLNSIRWWRPFTPPVEEDK